MLIVCPHCASTYEIETQALGLTGRQVRCGVCRTLWFVALAVPDEKPAVSMPPPGMAALTLKQRADRFARVGAIVLMGLLGAFVGFSIMGEWPRRLMPMARSMGLERPLWPELAGVEASLETTQEGATVLSIHGEWIGAARSATAPAVEFAVLNSSHEEVARWTDRSGPTKLPAGERAPFRSRFVVPGGDARAVSARYVGYTPERPQDMGSQ